MRFTTLTLMALITAFSAYAVKVPGGDDAVKNLPDGGTTVPELPCVPDTYVDYIEKCTAQLDGGDFSVESMDRCMRDAGCPDLGERA